MLAYDYHYLRTKKYSITDQQLTTTPTILIVDNKAAVQEMKSVNDRLTK